jgi:hypothetical protein
MFLIMGDKGKRDGADHSMRQTWGHISYSEYIFPIMIDLARMIFQMPTIETRNLYWSIFLFFVCEKRHKLHVP